MTTDTAAVGYRSVLAHREFRAVLLSQGLSVFGDQLARLALAVLVFRQTGSAFAASATYAVFFLAYLAGGPVLSSLADRLPRRRVMVSADLACAVVVGAMALPRLPVLALFALLVLLGLATPANDSSRSASLPDMLQGDAYTRGNAVLNLVCQAAQVFGFVTGGALLAVLPVAQVLLLDAATFLLSALALRVYVQARPALASTGVSVLRDTVQGVRLVAGDARLRRLLGFALLSAAAVAAPESLAIPVAAAMGGGTLASGVLTASLPAGFLAASFAVLRVAPERRERLLLPLTALSAGPLLLTPLSTSVPVTTALWLLAGIGSSLQLVANAAYVVAAPAHARGRAYGVAATLLMAAQGGAQMLGGALASATGPRGAVALIAGLTLLLLLPLTGSTRRQSLKQPPGTVDGPQDG